MLYLVMGLSAMAVIPIVSVLMVLVGLRIFSNEVGKREVEDNDEDA